jgi:hypothetical protein
MVVDGEELSPAELLGMVKMRKVIKHTSIFRDVSRDNFFNVLMEYD